MDAIQRNLNSLSVAPPVVPATVPASVSATSTGQDCAAGIMSNANNNNITELMCVSLVYTIGSLLIGTSVCLTPNLVYVF